MCRQIVVTCLWGDDQPEDAEPLFDPAKDYDELTEEARAKLQEFLENHFFGFVGAIEVRSIPSTIRE